MTIISSLRMIAKPGRVLQQFNVPKSITCTNRMSNIPIRMILRRRFSSLGVMSATDNGGHDGNKGYRNYFNHYC